MQHKKYIKGRPLPKFEIDDKVFIKKHEHIDSLCPKYDGPHVVTKKFRNNNYLIKIEDERRNLTKKFHASKLFLGLPSDKNFVDKNELSVENNQNGIND